MKKLNSGGFVLAETLIVTVFLMTLFAMIYSNFFPLVGEYEKRETYDDVDSKYAIYWLKSMIESAVYDIEGDEIRKSNLDNNGYVRFNCKDLTEADSVTVCKDLIKALQVNGCDRNGNNCDIYITYYRIGNSDESTLFKNIVLPKKNEAGDVTSASKLKRYRENCSPAKTDAECKQSYIATCEADNLANNTTTDCEKNSEKNVFSNGFSDYLLSLPDYITPSPNNAKYRVFAIFHNRRDNNNYYSYATIEVNRN